MCCRYYMEMSPELKPIVDAASRSPLRSRMTDRLGRALKTEGEIRPADICAALAPDRNGKKAAFPMVWGYTGQKSPLFNARAESADSKPLWKESLLRRRCIIPASWYFEWEHLKSPDGKNRTGDKYMIQPRGSVLTLMAGIYRIEDGIPHFAILTREPGEEIRFIHDRMPVILDPESAGNWISTSATPEQIREMISRSLTGMVYEKAN